MPNNINMVMDSNEEHLKEKIDQSNFKKELSPIKQQVSRDNTKYSPIKHQVSRDNTNELSSKNNQEQRKQIKKDISIDKKESTRQNSRDQNQNRISHLEDKHNDIRSKLYDIKQKYNKFKTTTSRDTSRNKNTLNLNPNANQLKNHAQSNLQRKVDERLDENLRSQFYQKRDTSRTSIKNDNTNNTSSKNSVYAINQKTKPVTSRNSSINKKKDILKENKNINNTNITSPSKSQN